MFNVSVLNYLIHNLDLFMARLKQLIFDADDTLWENNKFFIDTTESFYDLCVEAGFDRKSVIESFNEIEIKSVKENGYGSESFIFILDYLFSNFNNKIRLDKKKYDNLIANFESHTKNNPPLFPGVPKVLEFLAQKYDLFVLTKGNISEQQEKINRSGLKKYFKKEFVVSEKNDDTYLSIIKEYNWIANECCMIGNSPKSDINPALRCGMYTIFIPYAYTWKLDNEKLIKNKSKSIEAKNFSEIPLLIDKINNTQQ